MVIKNSLIMTVHIDGACIYRQQHEEWASEVGGYVWGANTRSFS